MAIENLMDVLTSIEMSGVVEHRDNVSMIRLFGGEIPELRDAITVTEAMAKKIGPGRKTVEIADDGPVTPLPLANYGGQTVFIHPSMVIKGGRHQDRTALYPGFIAPGRMDIPTSASVIVHCADFATMTSRGATFQGGATASAPLTSRVYALDPRQAVGQQQHTWDDINRLSQAYGVHTTNYLGVTEVAKADPFVAGLVASFGKPTKNQIGYILAVGNRERAPDIYVEAVWSPDLFAKVYSSLIEGAMITAGAEHFENGKRRKGIPWMLPSHQEMGSSLGAGLEAPLKPMKELPGVYLIDNGVKGVATIYAEKAAQLSLKKELN